MLRNLLIVGYFSVFWCLGLWMRPCLWMFYEYNFIILGHLRMCVCLCVNAWVPSCILSICPAGWLTERMKLIVFSPPLWCLQGREKPADLPTVQTAAGRVSVCRAGANPRAHPGLRQEGRSALQMPGWRFCYFMRSWKAWMQEGKEGEEIEPEINKQSKRLNMA